VYARRYGSRIEPSEGAVRLSDATRANQGMPRKEQVERLARPARGRGAPPDSLAPDLKPLPFRGSATETESGAEGKAKANGRRQ
jgi:hypothetical protein